MPKKKRPNKRGNEPAGKRSKEHASPEGGVDNSKHDEEDEGSSVRHCMRCHESFRPGGGGKNPGPCVIEHDLDSFEGSRNGTSWYTGYLRCCGADYRFHRHYSDDRANPKECYRGTHTTDPSDVEYNGLTVQICTADKCGAANHAASKEARDAQKAEAQRRKDAEEEAREKYWEGRVASAGPKGSAERRREERQARAARLGLDFSEDELNSDLASDGCDEFDNASDSSLVPPWG